MTFERKLLTPVGYDLTVGSRYLSITRKVIDDITESKPLVIVPTETVLIVTREYIEMPINKALSGIITSKM